jgi:carboxyl-terminal processing protease
MASFLNPIVLAISLAAFPSFAQTHTEIKTLEALPSLSQESQHDAAIHRLNQTFDRSHYVDVNFNDQLSEKMYQRYIESLDSRKYYLKQETLDKYAALRTGFDDAVLKRDLTLAFALYNESLRARFTHHKYAISLLESPIDFDIEDNYQYERSDLPRAKNDDELKELWRQRVKYDALSLHLTGKEWAEIKVLLVKRYHSAMKQLMQRKNEDAFQVIMNAYANSIETHTGYLSPRNSEQFETEMNLSLEGIGAMLNTQDDHTVIQRVIAGGPAAKSDALKSSDKIVGVAQNQSPFVDIIGWRLDDVVELIKGPRGTIVRLQILSGNVATIKEVSLIREKVKLEDRAAKVEIFTPEHGSMSPRLAVLTIPGFYNNLTHDVKKALQQLNPESFDGLIIDLRNNGGGSLQEAISLTGLFIDQGPVVQIRGPRDQISVENDRERGLFYSDPVTVLVNRNSASASEIFAAALQDYQRAIIIGEQTYGKGTVQQLRPLGRQFDLYPHPLGSVKYTMAKFYRISGGSTQHKGVVPDLVFPSAITPGEWGESQEENALPWDQIKKATYQPITNLANTLSVLQKKHQQRTALDPEFIYLNKDILAYKEAKDRTSVSLRATTRQREADKSTTRLLSRLNARLTRKQLPNVTRLEDAPDALKGLDPFLEETARITADLIVLKNAPPHS